MNADLIRSVQKCSRLSGYEFDLPKELIAQYPTKNRVDSRMLVLNRVTGEIEHRRFSDVVNYFSPGDLLVLNDTKVIPARIVGNKKSGAALELLFIEELKPNLWKVLIKSNGKLKKGEYFYFDDKTLSAKLVDRHENGCWFIEFDQHINGKEFLKQKGEVPLPPYIKRDKKNEQRLSLDRERYQTVFAKNEGAIAAPTAGLHFDKDIFSKLREQGVETEFLTLHVGMGTFFPIKTENIQEHRMHKEYYECSDAIVRKVLETKKQKRRVIATGTTSCRVLETIARNGDAAQYSGWTDLFIYPPYTFNYVDALITNFHLPRTTLLLLVCAFAGRENILNAYEVAKREGYRFFSYGDCMMII
jgi:S-adenosylmethionine:tRNA ribosyltransferase-isomerase